MPVARLAACDIIFFYFPRYLRLIAGFLQRMESQPARYPSSAGEDIMDTNEFLEVNCRLFIGPDVCNIFAHPPARTMHQCTMHHALCTILHALCSNWYARETKVVSSSACRICLIIWNYLCLCLAFAHPSIYMSGMMPDSCLSSHVIITLSLFFFMPSTQYPNFYNHISYYPR